MLRILFWGIIDIENIGGCFIEHFERECFWGGGLGCSSADLAWMCSFDHYYRRWKGTLMRFVNFI